MASPLPQMSIVEVLRRGLAPFMNHRHEGLEGMVIDALGSKLRETVRTHRFTYRRPRSAKGKRPRSAYPWPSITPSRQRAARSKDCEAPAFYPNQQRPATAHSQRGFQVARRRLLRLQMFFHLCGLGRYRIIFGRAYNERPNLKALRSGLPLT
jgi:hypothetical protein